jgi:hypothetical protein
MARQLLNTLYVMTPNSYLHLENDTVRVDVEREKKLQVPLHHLGSVVCLGNIMLSPALMHRCADDGISLVLLNNQGRFKARLEGAVSGNILLRQAQHRLALDEKFALGIAHSVRLPGSYAIAAKSCCAARVKQGMKKTAAHLQQQPKHSPTHYAICRTPPIWMWCAALRGMRQKIISPRCRYWSSKRRAINSRWMAALGDRHATDSMRYFHSFIQC